MDDMQKYISRPSPPSKIFLTKMAAFLLVALIKLRHAFGTLDSAGNEWWQEWCHWANCWYFNYDFSQRSTILVASKNVHGEPHLQVLHIVYCKTPEKNFHFMIKSQKVGKCVLHIYLSYMKETDFINVWIKLGYRWSSQDV